MYVRHRRIGIDAEFTEDSSQIFADQVGRVAAVPVGTHSDERALVGGITQRFGICAQRFFRCSEQRQAADL